MLLELLCHRNDIYLKAFRLRQLAESEKDIVGKVGAPLEALSQ